MTEMFGRWAQAPDLIEPILAYRCWSYRVNERTAMLFSLGFRGAGGLNDWDGAWRRWVTASCPLAETRHVAPAEACSCGFYALKSSDDASHMFGRPAGDPVLERQGCVLGRVQLAGKVIEHDSGYRAERARIAELIPTTSDGGGARFLASRLDLPLGAEIETGPMMEGRQRRIPLTPTRRARSLRPVERRRLKTHQRHFHLIQGGEDTSLN